MAFTKCNPTLNVCLYCNWCCCCREHTCVAVCVRVRLGVRIGQRWKQKREQAHNTCALRCVGFIISLSARDPCNSVREEGSCEWVGKDACYRFSGLATNHPKSRLEGKLNSASQHPLRALSRFRSLGFSLSVLALGWICCKLFQPSGRENGKVIPVLRVLQPTVLPVNIPSGIRLASHLMASSFSSSSSCGGRLCPPERGACASRIVVYLFAVTVAL